MLGSGTRFGSRVVLMMITGRGGEGPVSRTIIMTFARRLLAQRYLYGIDRNPDGGGLGQGRLGVVMPHGVLPAR